MRVGEEHRAAGRYREPGVLRHLAALVPGQGAEYGGRELLDHLGEPVDRGIMPDAGQASQQSEPGGSFDQGDDSGVAGSDDKVAFPMSRNGPVGCGGWAGADPGSVQPGSVLRRGSLDCGTRPFRPERNTLVTVSSCRNVPLP